MIPIYEEPYADEHICGWLLRLAEMNRMKAANFMEFYLPSFKWEHSADTIGNLSNIGFIDPMQLMRNNTLYFSLFPFMSEGSQAKLIQRFLYGGDIHWYQTVTYMRFCPKCLEEDLKMGRKPYYRVWHQLNEIKQCAKHGEQLLYIPKKMQNLNKDNLDRVKSVKGNDKGISKFIYELYQSPIYTSLEKWCYDNPDADLNRKSRLNLFRAGMEKTINSIPDYKYWNNYTCSICGKDYVAHPFVARTMAMCPHCYNALSREEVLLRKLGKEYTLQGNNVKHECGRILSGGYHEIVWSNRECPCKALPGLEDYKREFDDNEFSVIDYSRKQGKTKLIIKHKGCGNSFSVARSDFINRRYCRVCTSYEINFTKKFKAMIGDEYELLESPKSSAHHFRAIHNTCGFEFPMRAKNFMEGQRCPFCQKNHGFESTLKLLKENTDLTGYIIEDKSPDILVTLPDGEQKRKRFAFAIQELTRLDEPEIFVRKKRINPIISDKSKVWLYILENSDADGVFVYDKVHEKLGIANAGNVVSSLNYLQKSGHIIRIKKGVYKIIKKGDT